jgi:hypothetical protein
MQGPSRSRRMILGRAGIVADKPRSWSVWSKTIPFVKRPAASPRPDSQVPAAGTNVLLR